MFNILICDGEKLLRDRIVELLGKYEVLPVYQCRVKSFESPDMLLEESTNKGDIFFVDIEIGDGKYGVELAKKILERDSQAIIIFTTRHLELVWDTFEVRALRYLLKPFQEDKFKEAMNSAIEVRKNNILSTMICHHGQKVMQIPYKDIIYMETVERKLRVVTDNKEYIVDDKINEVDKKIQDKGFFRVHKSYIVNLKYVKEYDNNTITMLNGDNVYISRLKMKQFKDIFRCFLRILDKA